MDAMMSLKIDMFSWLISSKFYSVKVPQIFGLLWGMIPLTNHAPPMGICFPLTNQKLPVTSQAKVMSFIQRWEGDESP